MSIRLILLNIAIAGVCFYAWKDWFKSLCGLILIMAIIHHEDMPTNIFGIRGLNVWNAMFLMILFGWVASRQHQHLPGDMPRHVSILLLLYLGVILIGVLRAAIDRGYMTDYPVRYLFYDELLNTIKWVLPGLLLFYGCRTRQQVILAAVCLLVMYLLLSAQVIKRMPFESAFGGSGEQIQHTRLKVCHEIGYSSCDLSTTLAGASWGMLAALPLVKKKRYKFLVLSAAGAVTFGQALTGGRAGYVAWGVTGLVLCLLKWRKHLLLAPAVVILLPIVFPGVSERMLYGFEKTDATGQSNVDQSEVTSGRNLIWPYVISQIQQSPLIGYGRRAMNRTGLTDRLGAEVNEPFPHPHNMYLETLLDNGILGSIPIFIFWGTMVLYSAMLFRNANRLYSAVGGLTLALMLAQLVAGMSAQHFYPRESTFCVWMAMFLALRVYIEEARARMDEMTFGDSRNAQTPESRVVTAPLGA